MEQSFDTWKLVSLSPMHAAALALLCVAVVLGVVLASWGVRREPSSQRRWALWSLRVLAGVCVLFFLVEPGVRRLQVARVKNRVAVLVDRSASMGFPVSPGGPTRSQTVGKALEALQPQLDRLKDRFAFELYGFDPELGPVTAETLQQEPPRASHTDLLSALRAVRAGEGGASRRLSGVLVLSDGADNTELAQGLTARAKATLKELGVPVSTAAVGKGELKDLAIDTVKVDDFAFVRNSITADVDVHARGFRGAQVPVVLRREGQVVATRTIAIDQDDATSTVRFTFTPDQTGRFVYTVSVPVYPEEAIAENNSRSFALKVIRDRVRVLLVAGRPSWDERFLRGLLRQDANVELISFYILRNTADDTGVPTSEERTELSLIPFPREEIFREKINTFDLVIIMNFGNQDTGVSLSMYERDIRSYVLNGGALAYLGGDRSFGESKAGYNPLADVLPVEAAGTADLQAFQPRLTPDGLRHPVTALATGSQSTEAAWDALPAIPGMNLVRARSGATVLLEHPFTNVDGKSAPLLALWDMGRGRSLALMTDDSWHWAFTSHAQGAPSRAYERFWNNAIRWLVRDPDLTTMSVTADAPSVEPGRPVGVAVIARQADYTPAAGAQVEVQLVSPDDGKVVTQTGVAGPDGVVHVEFPPPGAGAYKLVGRASKDGKPLGESSDAVAVRAVGPELADARVNSALLSEIAAETGGRFFESPDFSLSDVPLEEPPLVEVGRSKDQPLWDRWYWLTLAVLIVGAEWALRRRFGYI